MSLKINYDHWRRDTMNNQSTGSERRSAVLPYDPEDRAVLLGSVLRDLEGMARHGMCDDQMEVLILRARELHDSLRDVLKKGLSDHEEHQDQEHRPEPPRFIGDLPR